MASFEVETGRLWTAAQATDQLSTVFGKLASVLRSHADSASATGEASSSAALRDFIVQWSKELESESESMSTAAHDLRSAAAIYETTEIFAARSFTGGRSGS